MNGDHFAHLDGGRFILLTTFRRSGEAAGTTVWFARVGSALGVFTSADAGKVKRIRNGSRVRLAPCNYRGKVKGEGMEASARIVTGDDAAGIQTALAAKYGLLWKMVPGRTEGAFIEITAAG